MPASYEHQRPAIIQVEVIETLKGDINENIEIVKTMWCYQSFPEDDLYVGSNYVFPLDQIDSANATHGPGLVVGSDVSRSSYKMFTLPTCSHNALLEKGPWLYTSERTPSGDPQIEYYMSLPMLKALLPIGLLWVREPPILLAVVGALVVAFVLIRRRRRKSVDLL